MDLDSKSKFVEMHQIMVLRQMLTFAREALHLEISINLNSDFSGILSGAMNTNFKDIGQAVDATKDYLRGYVAKQIDTHNKTLRTHIEKTKELANDRDAWKNLGEKLLEGKYEIPENKLSFIINELSQLEAHLKRSSYKQLYGIKK